MFSNLYKKKCCLSLDINSSVNSQFTCLVKMLNTFDRFCKTQIFSQCKHNECRVICWRKPRMQRSPKIKHKHVSSPSLSLAARWATGHFGWLEGVVSGLPPWPLVPLSLGYRKCHRWQCLPAQQSQSVDHKCCGADAEPTHQAGEAI